MRDGISWRGSQRGRRRQQEYYNPNQSLVLPSGRQARSKRAANVLVLFLILCFVTWTLKRFRIPPSIATDSLPRAVATRAVVLKLFRYHRHPQARNRSFTALAPVHRRRRGLLEDSETIAWTPQEIFDEEEQEEQPADGQGVGDNLTREIYSMKKRKGSHSDHEAMTSPQEASSPARVEYKWPVIDEVRKSDQQLQPLFAKVPIGYLGKRRDYCLIIDTGSGITWSIVKGNNGWFHPLPDKFTNCEKDPKLCENFQRGGVYPCEGPDFRCLFECKYVDGSEAEGSIIEAEVWFGLSDDSVRSDVTMAFGCANKGKRAGPHKVKDKDGSSKDEFDLDESTSDGASDGTLGLGRHPSNWLSQLHSKGLVLEYVVAVCLELGCTVHDPSPSDFERAAGFIAFGDLYTMQAASTIWTKPTNREKKESFYEARLVEIQYGGETPIDLRRIKRKRDDIVVRGVQMGFDTGSGLTYLPPRFFSEILTILKKDARRMRFHETEERGVPNLIRTCWQDKKDRKKSLVGGFADLIMKFSSLADDDTTSDFVIKPEYYLTSGGDKTIRTCFNIREHSPSGILGGTVGVQSDADNFHGILGAEAMSGHLLIFPEQPEPKIGWSPVTSCKEINNMRGSDKISGDLSPHSSLGNE